MMTLRAFLLISFVLTGGAVAAATAPSCTDTVVSREALQQEVEGLLQRASVPAYEKVAVELVGELPAMTTLPQLALKSAWPAGRVAVEMQWQRCGEAKGKLAWFKAQAFRRGWVYGNEATADTPLASAAPSQQLVDVAQWRLAKNELAAPSGDEFLVRAVKAGAPVRKADLKPAPLVKRNERVTVLVNGNGVQLRAAALALQFGAGGEWIAVLVDGAEKSMRARVVAPGVVHVDI